MKIKLKYPVKDIDGAVFEDLSFRRPTVKDMKALDGAKGEIEKVAVLIGRLATNQEGAQLSSGAVDQIDAEDFARIGEVVGSFFEKSPPTGAT